ncbi:MAG: LamG domain-containing protein [Verrucomicrobiota bacterium]
MPVRNGLLLGLALASLLPIPRATATVKVEGWWHYGETLDYYAASSTNSRRFNSGFSCVGGGNAGAAIVPIGVGGPLGTTGFTSTNALYWTPQNCSAAAMWNPWEPGGPEWNPPATNYSVECWILPDGPGNTRFFGSGSGDFSQPSRPARTGAGGVYFVNDSSGIGAYVIGNVAQGVPADVQIGDYVAVDTTTWMHVAIFNDRGTNTVYVNGVPKGASPTNNTIPNGNIFAGGSPGPAPTFHGYLDELRITTFAPGQFSTADLLLRPPGPNIVGHRSPQSCGKVDQCLSPSWPPWMPP